MGYHGVEDEEDDAEEMELEDEGDIKPGKKCSRCGKFMRGGGYCCSSESPKEGEPATDNPDEVEVKLPKPKKKRAAPKKIGSLAEDLFGDK